jgi:hypothetical protein
MVKLPLASVFTEVRPEINTGTPGTGWRFAPITFPVMVTGVRLVPGPVVDSFFPHPARIPKQSPSVMTDVYFMTDPLR